MANKISNNRDSEFARPVRVVVTNEAPPPVHHSANIVNNDPGSHALNNETSQLFRSSEPQEAPAQPQVSTPTASATKSGQSAGKNNPNSTQNALEIAEIR